MRQSRALKPRPCSYPRCCEPRPAEHDEILPVRHLHSLIRTGRGRRAGRPDHDLAAVAPVGMAAVTLAPPGRQRKVMTPLAPVPESGRKTETLWFRGGPGAGRRLRRARSPDPARLSRGRQPVSRSPVPVRPPYDSRAGFPQSRSWCSKPVCCISRRDHRKDQTARLPAVLRQPLTAFRRVTTTKGNIDMLKCF